MTEVFHFAVPAGATIASREDALAHIASTFGIRGKVHFVRAEPKFRLYKIEHTT